MMAGESALQVAWFVQRCAALHPHLRMPSKRQIRAWQAQVPAAASLAEDEGAERLPGGPDPAFLRMSSKREPSISPASAGAAPQPAGGMAERLPDVLAAVFRAVGLDAPEWVEAPVRDALPMVAILPGIGCRILYARTPDGHWLMEGPDGSQQLYLLPEGGRYAGIGAPASREGGKATALALFKEALAARKSLFVQAALASLIANVLALSASLYSMQVYDRVIPTQGVATLMVLTTGVAIAAVLELIVKMARSALLEHSVKGMDLELSHRIFLRLLGIRMDQFPASVGTLSAQLRSYETIRAFASSATLYLAVDAPFALLFLGVIGIIAGAQVAAVPLAFFVIALAIGLFYRRRIARHAESSNVAANLKLGLLVETVESAETVKASGAGWQQLLRWDDLNRQSVDDDVRIRRYSEHASYLAGFMQQISYILLVAVGAWIAATSVDLTMGGLIACSILSGRVLGPVGALPGLIVQWAHARAALGSLEKVFALAGDNQDVQRPLTPERICGEFQVAGLRFTYPGRPETVAVDQLHIRPGEKVAILGPVGAGKSTLLKLLAGLYMPGQGRVLLDGLDLQQISRHHLSEHVGYCPQDVKLLSGTLRDNLLMGLSGIDEEAILEACRRTGLAALVAAHPKGLDLTIAEGGSGVSGGQRQLIALTRLLLARPDVWLLDEPTAAMDEATEQRSLAMLNKAIAASQTLILVTHKPLLLRLIKRLIVLSPNGIVLDGPRDQVLEKLRQSAQAAPQERKGRTAGAVVAAEAGA